MTYQILSSSNFHENFKIIYEDSPTKQSLTSSYAEVPPSYINYKRVFTFLPVRFRVFEAVS